MKAMGCDCADEFRTGNLRLHVRPNGHYNGSSNSYSFTQQIICLFGFGQSYDASDFRERIGSDQVGRQMLYFCCHSLSSMAPKAFRVRHLAETTWQSVAKKPRTMTTNSALRDSFAKYADYLNKLNDKRERVVKASRDITMNSKKVIFQVHRIGKGNKDEVLEKAEKDLEVVRNQYISRLVMELEGTDFWKLRRAYSPGVQEYVEAATFCNFCRTGTLLKLEEINSTLLPLSDASIEPLQINILDYFLGLADVTGELMRMAISRISEGELEFAQRICQFARDIHRELTLLFPDMDDSYDMKLKMEIMLQSVMKIENACFSVHVRGSEYIPLLGSSDPNYSLMGMQDADL